jgi:hypothetical protein
MRQKCQGHAQTWARDQKRSPHLPAEKKTPRYDRCARWISIISMGKGYRYSGYSGSEYSGHRGYTIPHVGQMAPEISVIILGAKQDGDRGHSELIMITNYY